MFARGCQRRLPQFPAFQPTHKHRLFSNVKHETDVCGIPVRPTWSVNELLSSYPSPTLSSTTFTRLHELSALLPPTPGTLRHENLKQDLEGLMKLVEAVKLVDTIGVQPRQRHRVENLQEKPLDRRTVDAQEQATSGETLLQHAARTSDGLYVIDAEKKR